jgi:hypothetical protein
MHANGSAYAKPSPVAKAMADKTARSGSRWTKKTDEPQIYADGDRKSERRFIITVAPSIRAGPHLSPFDALNACSGQACHIASRGSLLPPGSFPSRRDWCNRAYGTSRWTEGFAGSANVSMDRYAVFVHAIVPPAVRRLVYDQAKPEIRSLGLVQSPGSVANDSDE